MGILYHVSLWAVWVKARITSLPPFKRKKEKYIRVVRHEVIFDKNKEQEEKL
jgi:hypothetical protein